MKTRFFITGRQVLHGLALLGALVFIYVTVKKILEKGDEPEIRIAQEQTISQHFCGMPQYPYSPEMIEHLETACTKQDDPMLIQYIRQRYIVGPSSLSYNLKVREIEDTSQYGQSTIADQLLKKRRNGFFVECGAADGEWFSNTLFLERKRNWTGLLIEANPMFYQYLLKKRRKAFSINAGLSTQNKTGKFTFRPAGILGGLDRKMDQIHQQYVQQDPQYRNKISLQCFNLFSMLLAVGRTHVDYFSLDIEGPELDVLNTIPFGKMTIDLFSIEYRSWGGQQDLKTSIQRLQNLRQFFKTLGGYEEVGLVPKPKEGADPVENGLDVFFQRQT